MAKSNAPIGQTYTRGTTEYQFFPEEYFSGADVKLYINDVWMDDVTGLSYGLYEKVQPIYGYASKTWDYVMRGQRIVQGKFRIAFREAGFLYTLLDHIGQLKNDYPAAPAISYLMTGQQTPKWHGKVQQRLETVLSQWGKESNLPVTTPRTKEQIVAPWAESVLRLGMTGPSVKKLQEFLAYEGYYKGAINGTFDKSTENAVKIKQRNRGEAQNGVVGDGIKNDYALKETVSVAGKTLAFDPNGWAEPRMVQYEQEVWGRDLIDGSEEVRKHESYFYRGRDSGNGPNTASLYQAGIDMYVIYGPLPEWIDSMDKLMKETAAYNTTVKAIRNIQIVDVNQIIDPSTGEVIQEEYTFIAKDLD